MFANRGHIYMMACRFDRFVEQFGRSALAEQLNITNCCSGRSVKDVAMYHRGIRDLVEKKGERNVAPPPPNMLGFNVYYGDDFHRQTRR